MKLTIAVFLFMCSQLSYGQIGDRSTTGGPGSISGRLEGPKGTKNPVNADVFLEIEDKIVVRVTTDSSGKFLIAPVNPGIYSVRIVHFDYLEKSISPVPVQAVKSTNLGSISLAPRPPTDLGTLSLAPRPPADSSFALGWIEDGEITTALKPSRRLSNNVGFAGESWKLSCILMY
ncbi:MAG: carboxypeptidase regulatory-like domain-containing protein [Flavobacteriales bacterium]|nr:carboxypeptidase regulatory-like domain-containing protein [Flavobacteriales bacterium]